MNVDDLRVADQLVIHTSANFPYSDGRGRSDAVASSLGRSFGYRLSR